jgi:hypothetical protein
VNGEIGRMEDADGLDVVVGCGDGFVTFGAGRTRQWPILRFTADQAAEFAGLVAAALEGSA